MDQEDILINQALEAQQGLSAVEQFAFKKDFCQLPDAASRYTELIPKNTPGPGQQYAFEVNLDQCTGCKACVAACHNENGLDEDETWRAVGLLHGTGVDGPAIQHVTSACHHCLEPACMDGCPVKAYEKDPITGVVKHLDDQCIGCQYCILKCPYDVPKYNKKKGIVHKCDMCINRLNVGEAPACVKACPSEAIRITLVDTAAVRQDPAVFVNIPQAPDSRYTLPTTRYVTAKSFPADMTSLDATVFEPQHPHMPLVVMLVLTQLSVGAFFMGWLLDHTVQQDLRALLLTTHACSALGVGLLALTASILHLGRPLYAFRAVLGLATSWLSREIAAFGIFAFLATAYAAQTKLMGEGNGVLAGAVLFTGLVAVLASVMVYRDTHRVLWDTPLTTFKFLMTAAILGTAMVMAVSLSACAVNDLIFMCAVKTIALPFTSVLIVFSAGKMLVEASLFSHGHQKEMSPLKKSAILMAGPLRAWTSQRFIYGIVGGIVLPVLLVAGQDYFTPMWILVLMWGIVGLCVAAEMMERYLFFRAVIPLKMPQ